MKHDVFYMTTKRFIPMQLAMQMQMLNVLSNSNYQNMKKLLSVLALMLCVICCMADNKIYYTTTDDQKLQIDEYFAYSDFGADIVSHTFGTWRGEITFDGEVTKIKNAFANQSTLETITIPNSVTSIGTDAFYECTNLRSVNIPNLVKTIGQNSFEGCKSLKSITIPNSVISIDQRAFAGCESLKSITIPNSVISINQYAFEGCIYEA